MSKEDVELFKVVGARMKDGRELCGYTLSKAAKLLSIERNFLAKIEAAQNLWVVPLTVIYKASSLYDISTDFIFGFTNDDWERDPVVLNERQFGVLVHKYHINELSKMSIKVAQQQQKINALSKSTELIITAISELSEAVNVFKKLNDFDDLKAGSKLAYRMNKAVEASNFAIRLMLRSKVLPKEYLSKIIGEEK